MKYSKEEFVEDLLLFLAIWAVFYFTMKALS